MATIKLATWNINSVRLRIGLVEHFARLAEPDILCLQETKTPDNYFPEKACRDLGFTHLAYTGQKGYNGVAILSRLPLADVKCMDVLEDGSARHISATLPNGVALHNFYIPAGGPDPDPEINPKFADKLRFADAFIDWSSQMRDKRAIVVGDLNIAPHEQDVWSHKQLLNVVSHTPAETQRLLAAKEAGQWHDAGRVFVPMDDKLYSWWSYRNRDWRKSNRGRRLDHIWVTDPLAHTLKDYQTFTDARGWTKPSDHVPIMTTLEMD